MGALQEADVPILRGDRPTLFFNSRAKTTEPWNNSAFRHATVTERSIRKSRSVSSSSYEHHEPDVLDMFTAESARPGESTVPVRRCCSRHSLTARVAELDRAGPGIQDGFNEYANAYRALPNERGARTDRGIPGPRMRLRADAR